MGMSDGMMEKALGLELEMDKSTSRTSQDKVINNYGKFLFQFIYKFHLVCLNGSQLDTSNGYYTFLTDKGASVVDYVIGSSAVLPYVYSLAIEMVTRK